MNSAAPAGIYFNNVTGVLWMQGDAQDNYAKVMESKRGLIHVELGHMQHVPPVDDNTPPTDTPVPDFSGETDAALVKEIRFFGREGDDSFDNNTAIQSKAYGHQGNDRLVGGWGNDWLYGDGDRDFLDGRAGNDKLYGGVGNDSLIGGFGNDTLSGNAGDDYYPIEGALLGTDTITEAANSGADLLDLSKFSIGVVVNLASTWTQTLATGQFGHTRIKLSSSTGIEKIFGTDFNDTLSGNARDNQIYGNAGDDWIFGESGQDFMVGGDGDDYLDGQAGGDSVYGDDEFGFHYFAGADTLHGGAGGDYLSGGAGHDQIFGGIHADHLHGGSGNDMMYGGAGADVMYGGSGDDLLEGGAAGDTLHGDDNDDTLMGDFGNDNIYGGNGNDELDGGSDHDNLHGGAGNDHLNGRNGNDALFGNSGNDVLTGGHGIDTMNGGAGGYDVLYADRGNETLSHGEHVEIIVPAGFPQDDNWSCGPNSAARLLQSYGIQVSYQGLKQQAAAGNIISEYELGTPGPDLLAVMQVHKPNTQLDWGVDFQMVIDLLAQGRPVIALIGWGQWDTPVGGGPTKLHYIVLTGYDLPSQQIFFMDTNGAGGALTFAAFQEFWDWYAWGNGAASLSAIGVEKKTILW